MPQTDIKTAKHYRRLARIAFCLVNFLAPVVIIGLKYKLFTEATGLKWSILGLIILVLTIYRFKNKLVEWINNWEYSTWKYILLGFGKIAIFVIAWVIAMLAEKGIGHLAYCLGWVCLCSAVAYLLINPYIEKYDYIVKRELRKQETKEALRELEKEKGN
jgi:hypothetical protein